LHRYIPNATYRHRGYGDTEIGAFKTLLDGGKQQLRIDFAD